MGRSADLEPFRVPAYRRYLLAGTLTSVSLWTFTTSLNWTVLGETGSAEGNGSDDNFGLRRGSPAIDAANAYVAPATDIEGRLRKRDPGTVDTGEGWPLYVPAQAGASDVAARAGETALNLRSTNSSSTQALGFGFGLYGTMYTQVSVNSNGYLHFAGPDGTGTDGNDTAVFLRNVRIAPLWDDLNTAVTGGDVFVDRSVANQIRFRWVGQTQGVTPAGAVVDVLADAARAGIHHALVLTAGFGETGTEGRALEARVAATARARAQSSERG